MRKGMFGKLAVQNIRNNRSTYVPYMLTCIFCIAMMYMMEFLRDCPTLEKAVPQAAEVRMIVGTGEVVVGIFCVIFQQQFSHETQTERNRALQHSGTGKRPYRKSDVSGNNHDFAAFSDGRDRDWHPWKQALPAFAFPFSSCSGSAGILCFHYRNPVLHRRIWRDFSCYSGTESYQSKDE